MFVHLISLLGGRNKVIVFINWVSSYINYNGGTRLIIRKFEREGLTNHNHLPETVDLPASLNKSN
jgi:NADH dehydrogenase